VEGATAAPLPATANLGEMYRLGTGVKRNAKEAAKWLLKAAEQGAAESQNSLGEMYRDGEGVEKNSQKAIRWFRKAARQGHERGIKNYNALMRGLNN
jgi:TPR repeat protein